MQGPDEPVMIEHPETPVKTAASAATSKARVQPAGRENDVPDNLMEPSFHGRVPAEQAGRNNVAPLL
jgi:hypothetical protein